MCSGGLGFGLPAALGVAMGKPGKRVIALIGDGSTMYAVQALWTAAQRKLPMTLLILKNQRYAALHEFARIFGYKPGEAVPGTALPDIDFVGLAAAQGVNGVSVATADALKDALSRALVSTGPMLVEIDIA